MGGVWQWNVSLWDGLGLIDAFKSLYARLLNIPICFYYYDLVNVLFDQHGLFNIELTGLLIVCKTERAATGEVKYTATVVDLPRSEYKVSWARLRTWKVAQRHKSTSDITGPTT